MNSNKYIRYLYMMPVVVAISVIAGIWIGVGLSHNPNSSSARDKLARVFDIIEESYVDDVPLDSIIDISLREILTNLDPHSVYISPAERAASERELESSFYGVGIQFQMVKDTLYVVEVITGGAAEQAGMLAGDRIIKVDGKNITGPDVTTDSVFHMLRGEEGTPVDVTVKRHNSSKPIDFHLIRVEIPVTPVDAAYMLNDSTGYMKISKFSDVTYPDFLRNFNQLRFKGARSLVLDLRGNTGGYMQPAVLMANEFFNDNTIIVSTRGRNWQDNSVIASDRTGSFGSEQLVVLIDEYTASASEIFAGAIQDNDRGLIIGRRSFGKGLVQTQEELSDGSAMRITTARYYTPSGRCIQKPFKKGDTDAYQLEIYDRYLTGEAFSADSVKLNEDMVYHTASGRKVYGGGGIMPDVFIPADTTNVTGYYTKVINSGLMHKFSFKYADANRSRLDTATSAEELVNLLPSDSTLLNEFVSFAAENGVPTRWYYVNISRPLIVNTLKALIARDVLGSAAFYEIDNTTDNAVNRAISIIESGEASEIRPDNDDD